MHNLDGAMQYEVKEMQRQFTGEDIFSELPQLHYQQISVPLL